MIFTKIICLLCLESVLFALFGRHLKSRTKNVSIFKPFNFLECFLPQSFMRHVSLELNKYFFIHLHLIFSELMDTIDSAASRYVDTNTIRDEVALNYILLTLLTILLCFSQFKLLYTG